VEGGGKGGVGGWDGGGEGGVFLDLVVLVFCTKPFYLGWGGGGGGEV